MMRKILLVIGACVVLLVLARLLCRFSLFHAQKTPPPIPLTVQTTWTIKFHVASGSIQYDGVDFTPSSGGCKYTTGALDPKNLIICQHDIVKWQATTSRHQHDLIVFMSDDFLQDAGNPGTPRATFLGKDGSPTTPPALVVAPDTDPHDWFVVVIDRLDPGNSAHGDPKIKVGG
jgi:hypothetical protein